MDRAVYEIEAAVEQSHWWFVGRRRLFARELLRAGIPRTAAVLDIGTGTGSNLRMLRELGFSGAIGLDVSEDAIRFCAGKGLGPVRHGDVGDIPFADASFDLVIASDIVEHVEDDARALREIVRVLRPGGCLLLTVPAFRALWGLQDRVAHHRRRYRLAPLRRLTEGAGLRPLRLFYFNYLLFLPIWLGRKVVDRLNLDIGSEAALNTPLLNRVLGGIFRADLHTAPLLRPPFGVSILLLAAK